MTESQWGQLVLLVTTVAGFVVAEWRAARNRRWAIADRAHAVAEAIAERKAATAEIIERAAAEAEATRIKTEVIAEGLRHHTATTAARLREEARIAADDLVQQAAAIASDLQTHTAETTAAAATRSDELAKLVAEAATAAKDAYKEANHVNVKIEDLNQRLLHQGQLPNTQLEKLESTTDGIDEKVTEIRRAQEATGQPAAGSIPAALDHIQTTTEAIDDKVDVIVERQVKPTT